MPRDLLNDIKSSAPAVDLEKGEKQPSRDEKKDKPEMKQSEGGQRFFSDLEDIRSSIAKFESNVREVEALHGKALNAVTEEQGNIYAKELERIMAETNKLAQQMRGKLKSMDAENKKLQGKNDSEYKLRTTQHSGVLKKFMDVMEKYKSIQQMYQEKYKQRLKRQFLIVKPNASKDEVEKVLDGGETGPIFAQSIVMTSAQMEAGAALSDIQNRHEDIVRIERSIIELQQLFIDMAVMVQGQGEILNRIEDQVNSAIETTEAGVQALRKANKLQRSARKKKCIIAICLIVILVCISLGVGIPLSKKK